MYCKCLSKCNYIQITIRNVPMELYCIIKPSECTQAGEEEEWRWWHSHILTFWHASFHTHKLTLLLNITKLLGQWKVEEQSLLCGEVITIVDLSPQTHVDGWWRGNQPDNMGCLEWKRWYHWSLVMGCLTQANFSILPVNDRFVLPSIAHACSDHLIVVVTWESHDLIICTHAFKFDGGLVMLDMAGCLWLFSIRTTTSSSCLMSLVAVTRILEYWDPKITRTTSMITLL